MTAPNSLPFVSLPSDPHAAPRPLPCASLPLRGPPECPPPTCVQAEALAGGSAPRPPRPLQCRGLADGRHLQQQRRHQRSATTSDGSSSSSSTGYSGSRGKVGTAAARQQQWATAAVGDGTSMPAATPSPTAGCSCSACRSPGLSRTVGWGLAGGVGGWGVGRAVPHGGHRVSSSSSSAGARAGSSVCGIMAKQACWPGSAWSSFQSHTLHPCLPPSCSTTTPLLPQPASQALALPPHPHPPTHLNAVDGEGGLRDVGGDHHLAGPGGRGLKDLGLQGGWL